MASQVLQSGTTYLSSYAYMDGAGRAREAQTPLPDDRNAAGDLVPYRQVAVARYDSAGQVAGTSAVFRSSGTASSGGPTSPERTDIPSYNDIVLDWAGRTVVSQIQVYGAPRDEGKVTSSYDGDFTSVKPAVGTATDTCTDVYGQVSKVIECDGSTGFTTSYAYTGKGELKQITDTRGNNTLYAYDWAGQRLTVDDPDAGASATEYDANGQITKTTSNTGTASNPATTVLDYGYDNLGRKMSVRNGSTELAAWTWGSAGVTNGKGQITSTTSRDTAGNTYTTNVAFFDTRGRALSSTVTIPSVVTGLAGSYTTSLAHTSRNPAPNRRAEAALRRSTVTASVPAQQARNSQPPAAATPPTEQQHRQRR